MGETRQSQPPGCAEDSHPPVARPRRALAAGPEPGRRQADYRFRRNSITDVKTVPSICTSMWGVS